MRPHINISVLDDSEVQDSVLSDPEVQYRCSVTHFTQVRPCTDNEETQSNYWLSSGRTVPVIDLPKV